MKITEYVYEMRIKKLLSQLSLISLPEIIAEGELTYEERTQRRAGELESNKLHCFKNGSTHDFYYNRLQIHIDEKEGDKRVEIFISAEENPWHADVDNCGRWITDSNDVEKFRVYAWQLLTYITGHSYDNEEYYQGSWNRYVHRTLSAIVAEVEACQECVKYDNLFKNA